MGWPAESVAATSLWRFQSAWSGWLEANGRDGGDDLTSAEEDALWAMVSEHR